MPVVSDLVQWCVDHFLRLNISEIKYMVIDVRNTSLPPSQTFVKGQEVETVESYNYLCTYN